jgi:hypothetical protein
MFDELGYDTSIHHMIMEISHDENIIGRGTEVCGLYMLDDSIIIGYASLASQNSHGNLEI